MAVERLAHAVQPVEHRLGVEDHLLAIGGAHRRHRIMDRVLEFLAQRGLELRRGEQACAAPAAMSPSLCRKVAAMPAPASPAGCVAAEILRQLAWRHNARWAARRPGWRGPCRSSSMPLALDGGAQEMLVAEIMALGLNIDQARRCDNRAPRRVVCSLGGWPLTG